MKITKTQLKEIVRKIVKQTLKEEAPTWGPQNTPKGLGGFAGKTGPGAFKSNVEKAKMAVAEKEAEKMATGDRGADKTMPGAGKADPEHRQRVQKAREIKQLKQKVYQELDSARLNQEILQAVLRLLRKEKAN